MVMPTGNGIIMSAGSSDFMGSQSDVGLKTSSTISADLAGLMDTALCGFRSLNCTTTDPTSISAWAATCASFGSLASDTLTSFSKSTAGKNQGASDKLAWSAGGIKDSILALSLALQIANIAKAKQTSYGVTLTSKDQSTSSSLIQAKAGVPELVGLALSLLFRATSGALDWANAGTLDGEDVVATEDGKDLYYDKDFNKVSKQAAQRSYSTSSIASLLPEITSTIVMIIAACKQERKLGGISLNAVEENVNLNAGTSVTAHADGSILLHAGALPAAGILLHAGALPAAGAPLNNTPTLAGTDGVHAALKSADIKGPAHWGVGLDAAHGIAEDVIDKDYNFLCTDQKVNLNAQRLKSIASISELIYDRSTDSVSISKRDKVDYADNRVIARGGSKGATTCLQQNQWLGYTPSQGTVKLGVVTGNYPSQADVVDDNAFSGAIMENDAVRLQWKKESESSLALEDKSAKLTVQNKSTVSMSDKETEISAETVTLKNLSGGKHSLMVDGKGIHIDGFDVTGGRIKARNEKRMLEIQGGIIKIG